MSLESSVRECGATLGSVRATDRKKSGESLKNFLCGNAVPALLTENTIRGTGYNWNCVFDDVNELVLKETEKYESSKTFETTAGPLCANLLHLCVSGSIKGQAFVRCDKVVDCCLQILRDKRLMRAIGDAYLNLLYKYILSCDHYLMNITPIAWEELLEVCLSICNSKHTRLDEFTKLRLVLLIIKNAKNNCQFVIPLRDSLSTFKKVFTAVASDKKVLEVVIDINIVLLETLSAECRSTMCEFTEGLLSTILKSFDHNLDQKKKCSLFKLLNLMVKLHHPLGRTRQENGSVASNWELWNKHLHNISEVICLEVAYLQKQRKPTDWKNYIEFHEMAASVYYQIFNTVTVKRDQEEGEASTKRVRLSYNRNNCFYDLVEEMKQNHLPWLSVIHVYVKKYGHSICGGDYRHLLEAVETLITHTGNLDWNILGDLACLIVTHLITSASKNGEDDALISLWNSCIRTSSVVNVAHSPVHSVMQLLLSLNILNYENVQPLVKLYFEKAMPVTDHSLITLNSIFQKFFSKFSNVDERLKYFTWLKHNSITSIEVVYVTELLLRLLATENVVTYQDSNENCSASLHDILFDSTEKAILFSEFEIDDPHTKTVKEERLDRFELHEEVNKEIREYFENTLSEYVSKLNSNDVTLLDFIKFNHIAICYFNILLKYDLSVRNKVEKGKIFSLIRTGVQATYSATTNILKKDGDIRQQIKVLQALKSILMTDYDTLLSAEIRRVPSEFFKSLNFIVNKKILNDDAEIYQDDDTVMDPQGLRHICICLLAAYCRKRASGRAEILDFILDPKIYSFSTSWDVDCALESLEILYGPEVEESPLDSIFFLMQGMCKELFKNSEATYKMLKVFLTLFDKIRNLENGKQNCYIMVRGYLQRCEKRFYPPYVAALIYESATKMVLSNVNNREGDDNVLLEAVQNKVKGEIHSIRVYCCYLLKRIVDFMSDRDIVEYLEGLMDIFVINVADTRESILKDELTNRTVTVLHSVLALVQMKNSLLHDIISQVIQIQKEKSLDKTVVKKVLDKITKLVENKSVEDYFIDNVVFILNSWYSNGYIIDNMPFYLFGMNNMSSFIEKHFKWAIPADILWRHRGSIKDSAVFKYVLSNSDKTAEGIVEACICNIIALSLPYYVNPKSGLNYSPPGKQEWSQFGIRMFETSREIIGTEKWSSLFAENISELVILVAMNFNDNCAASQEYSVNLPAQKKSYHYPLVVFNAILKHMGELIEEDILNYLCANQALTVFKTLFQLWTDVIDEKVFEYKVLYLNSYVTFFEIVPLDHPSDAFVCNFACNSLGHAIKQTKDKEELRVFTKALKKILQKILPGKVDLVRKPVSQILTTLMIKKEEGFEPECANLLEYLVCDMKDCLNESEDVIDFISSLSQGVVGNMRCSNKTEFLEWLNTYKKSLSCLSHETLANMREFLKNNKEYMNNLCNDFNKKGFSDDCGTSILHQIIHSLSNILKTATDEKTMIEACNCLAQIGNYDLKTLVTVPPTNIDRIQELQPKLYFAIVVLTSLTEILFGESPLVTNGITKTLKRLLQYREGEVALEFESANRDMLLPLTSSSCDIAADFKIIDGRFKRAEALCAKEFWVPKTEETHEQWLLRITCAILEVLASPANYLNTLQSVCSSKPNICRKILAPLLGLLLECSSEAHIKVLSNRIDLFFNHMYNQNYETRIENSEDSERRHVNIGQDQKMIIQYMLDVVNFVRLQREHYKLRQDREVESLNYLRLDYAKVAGVATVADQNVAAIYYGELWAVSQNNGVPPASPDAMSQLGDGDNVQRIFRKCFVSIGEMDAIDGCGTAHLTSEEEKRKHMINTGQFSDALLLHDIALSCGGQVDPNLQYGVVKSLHKSGMHHLALQYIKSLPERDDLNDIKYECLSFLGDWSDFVDTRELEEKLKETKSKPYSIIKAFRYSSLKDCLNVQPNSDFDTKLVLPLNRAKKAIAKLCQNLNMENCQNVYKVLSKLHLFNDIEDYFAVRSENTSISSLLQCWQVENLPDFNDFKHLEALISQRSLVLQHAAKEYQASLKDIVSLQMQYAELGLCNERVQMAQRILAVVKKVYSSPEVTFTESQISWAKGHKDIALSLLRNTVSGPSQDAQLTAVSLRQYGLWMAESKRDNARDIINKYLQKSLEYLNNSDHEDTRLKVYFDIAKFADAEYKQIVAYMNSSIFEKKVQCVENLKGTANSLRPTQQTMSKDEKKAFAASDKFGKMDEAEIENTKQEKNTFLQLAMRYYLLSLKQSELNNLSVFRVISLWLDNPGIQLSDAAEGFEELLHSIPSRKYVTVLPQLAPRLTNEKSLFADNLKTLLKRCALEHPHHTLPILFSLKNSYKDKMILNASEKIGSSSQRVRSQEPRVTAADALVNQLAKDDGDMAKIIKQMDMMCDAIISLANYVPQKKEIRQKIPSAERIPRLGSLDAIPVPTVTLPLSPNGKYNYLPSIVVFDDYFELVGGINCPKKINCHSSDGKKRILLIKGEDDLRQDAVMQQVFNIVNTLLEKDPITSRSKILIRTYKVVPMSKKSGVLEWCEGTMPIGTWLTGSSGAHARYRPRDLSSNAARSKMQTYFEQRKSANDKLVNFLKILKEFRPVFHYFFTEHFLDPVTWYERRLAYTKSVASSSMVGYILGLGDRHLQNILIDKRTAEVVHIDFGIAFDQGKTLPTPETIPFRLTQDIIAGFGSSGVEGIFRRSCEKSMQLLRDNQEMLLTILEVLLHDPLYSWSVISKQQNVSAQSRDTSVMLTSGSEGSLAKRALLTVSSKLSGTEGGVAGGVAVAGQVARLIHCAQDPANLSRLYPGWQPYL